MINNAAREGVRTASVGGSSAEVVQTVKDYLPGHARDPHRDGDLHQAGRHGVHDYDTDAESGGTAIVKVTYLHPWVTPVGSMFGGNTISLVKTSRMRIE